MFLNLSILVSFHLDFERKGRASLALKHCCLQRNHDEFADIHRCVNYISDIEISSVTPSAAIFYFNAAQKTEPLHVCLNITHDALRPEPPLESGVSTNDRQFQRIVLKCGYCIILFNYKGVIFQIFL